MRNLNKSNVLTTDNSIHRNLKYIYIYIENNFKIWVQYVLAKG